MRCLPRALCLPLVLFAGAACLGPGGLGIPRDQAPPAQFGILAGKVEYAPDAGPYQSWYHPLLAVYITPELLVAGTLSRSAVDNYGFFALKRGAGVMAPDTLQFRVRINESESVYPVTKQKTPIRIEAGKVTMLPKAYYDGKSYRLKYEREASYDLYLELWEKYPGLKDYEIVKY